MRFVLLFVFIICLENLLVAQFPSFNSYSVSSISSVSFRYTRSGNSGKNKTEIPPWIIPGGLKSYFFVNGSDTYIWSSPSSLAENLIIDLNHAVGPNNASLSYIHSPEYHAPGEAEDWKRNYHGIYSAVYINHPFFGPVSLGFLHGENKNLVDGNVSNPYATRYQNTIQKNVRINPDDPDSYSGGIPFHEGWKAYNAIISASWVANNEKTNWGQQFFSNEIGPIAWPSTGYVTTNGVKCTSGLKHPSSIIADGYVYVFFSDGGAFGSNVPDEEGRHEGIKVIRAPVSDALNPRSYKVYYRDTAGNELWVPSLPAGFTKETMLNFISVKGPKSTDIMNDQKSISQEIRFSVAKVKDKNYYIGVEEYIDLADKQKFKVALRFSRDLIHWADRALVVYTAAGWDETRMNYPIFLSKDGWSNTEIDIDDFYILGTEVGWGDFVNRIHIQNTPAQSTVAYMMNITGELPVSSVFPNPNNGFFKLSYQINNTSDLLINIFDANGHKLQSIKNELKTPGSYVDDFNISLYPSGLYIVEVFADNKRKVYKIIKG